MSEERIKVVRVLTYEGTRAQIEHNFSLRGVREGVETPGPLKIHESFPDGANGVDVTIDRRSQYPECPCPGARMKMGVGA
ncbi:hypothetical protein T8K17_11290 [Thalassobaculum sp. OXR-137]|uniref:hypothetical protein n=1 Tax=Thalassobaculum sp. OXR-137 TaxID=3100173 RepID=UPI002AC96986|nr:hypothetical protein [Thalassobaculum sp. OXR-137]WPZ36719.1 hypothetical protein T8K17_11290 [Thalassobaculum sp. OXR-137]